MLMEYCSGGSLKELLAKQPLSDSLLQKFSKNIALLSCHKKQIVHSDIKTANILIDDHGRVKLCDFGLSKKIGFGERTEIYGGSLSYMAPEVLSKKPYDPYLADVYSLGITFYQMATGTLPWDMTSKESVTNSILAGSINLNAVKNKQFSQVISRMVRFHPSERLPLEKILKHPFFKEEKNSGSEETKSITPSTIYGLSEICHYNPLSKRITLNPKYMSQIRPKFRRPKAFSPN